MVGWLGVVKGEEGEDGKGEQAGSRLLAAIGIGQVTDTSSAAGKLDYLLGDSVALTTGRLITKWLKRLPPTAR